MKKGKRYEKVFDLGLFGKEVSKWLNAGPSEPRGGIFLVGAIVFVFALIVLWNVNKLVALVLDIGFGVLFGFTTAIGVLVIAIVWGLFVNRKPKPRAAERFVDSKKAEGISPAGKQAMEELDQMAAELLSGSQYNAFLSQKAACKTDDDLTYLYLTWDAKLREAWEKKHG